MFCELFSIYLRVDRWKNNPTASKREIGVVSWWLTPDAANDEPVSDDDLVRMKNFLAKYAPTSFRQLFPKN